MQPQCKKLYIHGWATDSHVWDGLLNSNDIAITLPSHGAPLSWSSPDLAPAVEAIKDALDGVTKDKKIVGIGWSLGGQALMTFASRRPEALHALVLIGASPSFTSRDGFPHGQSKALVRRMLIDFKKDPKETLKRFYRLNFTTGELEDGDAKNFLDLYEKTLPAFDTFGLGAALECLINIDIRAELDKIKIPVLIIHGGRDEICPVDAAHYLAEHIKNATLVEFKDSGHAPFITEPAKFTTVVEEFFEKL